MLGAARTAWSARAWAQPGNTRRITAAATLGTFTFTGVNGANFTTSLSQFGAGSLNATGADQRIEYNNWSGPYPSGTGDFCIEGWVWVPNARNSVDTGVPIVANQSGSGGGLGIRFGTSGGGLPNNFNNLQVFGRAGLDLDYAAIVWPRDTWVHWAVQRKSAVMSFWANGNKLAITGGSGGGTYNFAAPSNVPLTIGDYNSNPSLDEAMESYLDEICVSNSWRYEDVYSTYVVPTQAFTVDNITDMLIHFDSSLTTAAT